jgi:hypothetical protein
MINLADLSRFVVPSPPLAIACAGEELLVLTHSDYRPAANTLATWKRTKGITTTVLNVDGLTRDQIRARIQARYDTCRTRPSYVLLIGDVDTVETYLIDDIATDLP